MSAIQLINPKAEVVKRNQVFTMILQSATGLQNLIKTNLGPKGTIKMLVSGSGDLKLTKDTSVLLSEVVFQDPTAAMIARTAASQDDATGDGTNSNVLLISELLKQAARYVLEGTPPRFIFEGFKLAKTQALAFLESAKVQMDGPLNRELLNCVALTALATKVPQDLATVLGASVVDAVVCVSRLGGTSEQSLSHQQDIDNGSSMGKIDLHMVEIVKMQSGSAVDVQLIRGLVLDHGARHPDMPKKLTNAYILILNVSLEYEKTEVNSGFFYSSAEQRDKLIASERNFIDSKLKKIVDFKNSVCGSNQHQGDQEEKNFVIINQKGIDPLSLDILARHGILALRRAKRRNMERLQKACGGTAQNSVDDLNPSILGYAGLVYEQVINEEKYTFIEHVTYPQSVTLLLKAPNSFSLTQVHDAVRDGLRAVKNAIEDGYLIPGAGYLQVYLHQKLIEYQSSVSGKARLGVAAFAEALLIIPKTLAANSGADIQEVLLKLQDAVRAGSVVGVDVLVPDEIMDPILNGIWDNYSVVRHLLVSSVTIASNLLLVGGIMRAGRSSLKSGPEE